MWDYLRETDALCRIFRDPDLIIRAYLHNSDVGCRKCKKTPISNDNIFTGMGVNSELR